MIVLRCQRSSLLLVIIAIVSITIAEEVAKFAYKGRPESYHQKTMIVPTEMVALSEYQYVPGIKEMSNDTLYQPSIMFVIDHSGSMKQSDPEAARYKVTNALLDTLMRKCPLAEVGVLIFAGMLEYWRGNQNPAIDDDPYNVGCPGEEGGYCPLYQLNKTYQGKTGYEILKSYVETNANLRLTYKNNWSLAGTNITTGMNASKHAFTNTQRVRARHFNIFYSDGGANKPEGDPHQYVPGNDIATIFTVYFEENGSNEPPPQELLDFTKNVKKNGYSSNNPKSDIWSMQNVGVDTLLSFVMKNVMNNILKEGYVIPFEMAVNNGNKVNNWHIDSLGFTFPELFPLQGKITDFVFDIGYHKRSIYVNQQNGTVDTIDRDTTHQVEFEVDVDANQGSLPDSTWDVKRWDRTLGFYHNGNKVDVITGNMTELEIRFAFDPGDAGYQYSKAAVEVSNTSANGTDIERVDLSKNGNMFIGRIKRTVIADNASPTQGDKTLQHYQSDDLTAVFRNEETPQLVLDTLKITVPFEFGGELTIKKAWYYDNTADGYVDSILVETETSISGGLTKDHVKEIVDKALELPAFRGFALADYDVAGDEFYLLVQEDKNHNPFTYITQDDLLKFKQYAFSSGGMLQKAEIKPIDKIAPIIHWQEKAAILYDYKIAQETDTLSVTFSEAVEKVNAEEPFYFLATASGNEYTVKLQSLDQPDPERMLFAVSSVNGVAEMKDGDSLWIHETDRVKDDHGNSQNNPQNTRRKLYVEEQYGHVSVDEAYYFDNTGDGFVDSIYVQATTSIEGGLTEKMIDEIVDKAVELPSFRKFTINNSMLSDKNGFAIMVAEGAHNPTTYVKNEDILKTKVITLSSGGKTLAQEIKIQDRVAPIIHWQPKSAHLITHLDQTTDDSLIVRFSEDVKDVKAPDKLPFFFLEKVSDQEYDVELDFLAHPAKETIVFRVNKVLGVDDIKRGDSIWIRPKDKVTDDISNSQNNKNNPKRELFIERRLIPYDIIAKAVSPVGRYDKSSNIDKEILAFFGDKLDLLQGENGEKKGMILTIETDPKEVSNVVNDFELRGTVTIFDPLGNLVGEETDMKWWKKHKLLIHVWNLKNTLGRVVGPSSYMVVFKATEITPSLFEDGEGPNFEKSVIVGVRK